MIDKMDNDGFVVCAKSKLNLNLKNDNRNHEINFEIQNRNQNSDLVFETIFEIELEKVKE